MSTIKSFVFTSHPTNEKTEPKETIEIHIPEVRFIVS